MIKTSSYTIIRHCHVLEVTTALDVVWPLCRFVRVVCSRPYSLATGAYLGCSCKSNAASALLIRSSYDILWVLKDGGVNPEKWELKRGGNWTGITSIYIAPAAPHSSLTTRRCSFYQPCSHEYKYYVVTHQVWRYCGNGEGGNRDHQGSIPLWNWKEI